MGTVVLMAASIPAVAWAYSVARYDYDAAIRSKPNLEHGAELFRTCAACHGPDGAGTDDGGVPRIGGQHFRVLAKQLVDYRHAKRWDIRMERITDRHFLVDPQGIADVAAYVSQLEWPARPDASRAQPSEPGAAIYGARCQSCHGPIGEGSNRETVPRLAGQRYEYLVRQIYDAVDGRRPNLSRSHVRLLAHLDRDEILDVADFLSRS